MKTVELYTTRWCGYCGAAKRLLEKKGVAFTEIDVDAEPARRGEMVARSGGGMTVPQIFIDGVPIGGCDALYDLDRSGKLDPLLAV
jgi:glutaredoxin 3